MTAPITVLIVDDHPVVRDGLRGMLAGEEDFEVVGEASNGNEALALVNQLNPDVILMDLRMPELDGVGAIRKLRARDPDVRVLVLTTFDTDSDVLPAIEAGATGYLLKDTPRQDLFRAVRGAARGDAVLSPSVAGRMMRKMQGGQMRAGVQEDLSQRELEVLTLVAKGATNREVAVKLFISEATVKTHLVHAFSKLGVSDRAAAVATALQRGLLDLTGD